MPWTGAPAKEAARPDNGEPPEFTAADGRMTLRAANFPYGGDLALLRIAKTR